MYTCGMDTMSLWIGGCTLGGAGFTRRNGELDHTLHPLQVSQHPVSPVKLEYSTQENSRHGHCPGHGSLQRIPPVPVQCLSAHPR